MHNWCTLTLINDTSRLGYLLHHATLSLVAHTQLLDFDSTAQTPSAIKGVKEIILLRSVFFCCECIFRLFFLYFIFHQRLPSTSYRVVRKLLFPLSTLSGQPRYAFILCWVYLWMCWCVCGCMCKCTAREESLACDTNYIAPMVECWPCLFLFVCFADVRRRFDANTSTRSTICRLYFPEGRGESKESSRSESTVYADYADPPYDDCPQMTGYIMRIR